LTSSEKDGVPRTGLIVGIWLLLSIVLLVCAIPRMDSLGLYYDEAFLAQQARGFVEPERAGEHPASVRSCLVFGRPFPLRNAVYLGSLKSQLLIPALALAGPGPRVVRLATLATGLVALLLAMLWARRIFGDDVAVVMGLIVASDPSFYFFSQFEWGPFTTNFLCRAGGALLIVSAWRSALANGPTSARALAAAAGAGLLLGLGIFSRADFGLILASAGIALLLCRRDLVRKALAETRMLIVAGSICLLVAALPMLTSLSSLLSSAAVAGERGGLPFRAGVLWRTLDGSQFHRLMEVGGLFERAAEASAPMGLLGWLLLPATLVILFDLWTRKRRRELPDDDANAFLLITTLLLSLAMLGLPGAVRAHHQLNLMPLPQLIVAYGAVTLWRSGAKSRARVLLRGGAGLALVALLVCNIHSIRQTDALIRDTEGRGRWTRSLHDVARALDAEGGSVAVSLDWGFHEPLLLLTERARSVEAIWEIAAARKRHQAWSFEGDARTVYLVHDTPYDLFGLGPLLLRAVRGGKFDGVEATPHRDASGEAAFFSVRVGRPHRLVFDERFRIE
jgi:hypothetical protein